MSNATVCSGRYTIFARPTGLNQFLLLVSVALYDGEQLNLTRITRNEMGAYLCIATNGVPPTVSKRITVDVECEWVSRIYTYRRPTVKIHKRVPTRAFVESRVYPCVFFKKKGKKSTSLCLMFAFSFFFLLNEKKERKIFPLLEIRGSSMEKKRKKKMRGFCYWRKKGNGNGTGNVEGSSSISKWFRIR